MLEGIVNMENIYAYYVYDTETVHSIFMCCVAILGTTHICYVFDLVSGSMCRMQFLILNINDN